MLLLNPTGLREPWERGTRPTIAPATCEDLFGALLTRKLADHAWLMHGTHECAEFLQRTAKFRPVPLHRLLREGLTR